VSEFENYDDRFLQEAIAPIQNKVGQLLMSPHLRNILGQVKSTIDARFIMDNRRIFITNVSKGKLGADKSNLIGALLVTQFQLAAMSRADVPEHERRDFFLHVDEFQSFTSDSFISILSEARKYRLCLTLSHQYVEQLKPEIREAVFGNVGSIVSFRVGQRDADILEREFGGAYSAGHFTQLSNYEVYAKLLNDGQWSEPFAGTTLPPLNAVYGRGEAIIRRSRDKYATARHVVEDKIRRWMCGACSAKNEHVDDFPFVHRCESCGVEPKAYRCHYEECGKLIFLTKDELVRNYAYCINPVLEAREEEVERDTFEQKKRRGEYRLHLAQLYKKVELAEQAENEVKKRAEPQKEKTPEEKIKEHREKRRSKTIIATETYRNERKANEEKYKDDPEMLKMVNEDLEDWYKNGDWERII
jgi:hypothetical protein